MWVLSRIADCRLQIGDWGNWGILPLAELGLPTALHHKPQAPDNFFAGFPKKARRGPSILTIERIVPIGRGRCLLSLQTQASRKDAAWLGRFARDTLPMATMVC